MEARLASRCTFCSPAKTIEARLDPASQGSGGEDTEAVERPQRLGVRGCDAAKCAITGECLALDA